MKDRDNNKTEEREDVWRRLGRLVGLTGHIFDQETKRWLNKDAKIANAIIDGIIQEKIEEAEQDENSTDKS